MVGGSTLTKLQAGLARPAWMSALSWPSMPLAARLLAYLPIVSGKRLVRRRGYGCFDAGCLVRRRDWPHPVRADLDRAPYVISAFGTVDVADMDLDPCQPIRDAFEPAPDERFDPCGDISVAGNPIVAIELELHVSLPGGRLRGAGPLGLFG